MYRKSRIRDILFRIVSSFTIENKKKCAVEQLGEYSPSRLSGLGLATNIYDLNILNTRIIIYMFSLCILIKYIFTVVTNGL